MGECEMVRLGDVCDVLNGFAFQSKNYIAGGHRVVRITNVQKGVIVDDDPKYYRESPSLNKYELYSDDLLVSLTGNVGRVGLISESLLPAYLNQRVACLRIKSSSIMKEYLFATLNSDTFEKAAINSAKGLAQKNMSTEWLKEYPVPLPPLPVQQQIADALERASTLIEKRKAQIEKLDLLVKSQFIEMFGDANQMDKWACVSIGGVATVSVGVVIKPAQYYTDKSDGIKAFRSLNIGEMRIKADNWVYFTPEGHAKNSKSVLMVDDVLIVRSGAPGTACVVTKEYEGSNAIDVIIARPDKDIVNPVYLCAFTNNPHGKRQIEQGTGGAAQQHFNVGRYKDMTIALPPMVSQNQFATFVGQVEAQKSLLQQSLEKLELNYKSLMQKCFRGEMF